MRRDLTTDILTPSLLRRLWSRIPTQLNQRECWEWEGGRTPLGYGRISVFDPASGRNRDEYTHRLVYMADTGNGIPAGMVVMHSCDNPPCCNPAHLRAGSQLDNVRDRDRKGRGAQALYTHLLPEARRLYEQGATFADLERILHVRARTLWTLFRRHGVPTRKRGPRSKDCEHPSNDLN